MKIDKKMSQELSQDHLLASPHPGVSPSCLQLGLDDSVIVIEAVDKTGHDCLHVGFRGLCKNRDGVMAF